MMRFNQSILQLCPTYKNIQEKIQAGLLIKSSIILLVFQKKIILNIKRILKEAVILIYQKNYTIKEILN